MSLALARARALRAARAAAGQAHARGRGLTHRTRRRRQPSVAGRVRRLLRDRRAGRWLQVNLEPSGGLHLRPPMSVLRAGATSGCIMFVADILAQCVNTGFFRKARYDVRSPPVHPRSRGAADEQSTITQSRIA